MAVLGREAKKRREAAEAYDGAGRTELADRERAELAVLDDYLPAALSDEELARDRGRRGRRGDGPAVPRARGRWARS